MNIIGISAFYHDSACCLIKDGKIHAAAQEERFTRIKHDSGIPLKAFLYCLESAGLSIADIDYIAYYEIPHLKLARQMWSQITLNTPYDYFRIDPTRPDREIRERLGYTGPLEYISHHMSHAASSYYFSGFNKSAILTVDGVGEWATTTYGVGNGKDITMLEEVNFPDSIGLLYATITTYLGFGVNSGEYKVMGLAPYGNPVYVNKIRNLLYMDQGGQYQLDLKYFDFIRGAKMFSHDLIELFEQEPRKRNSEITQFHKDIAKSLQVVLEEALMEKVEFLYNKTQEPFLCMAGGVALNCVANGKILKQGPFKKIFIQPASNDSGCAIGAAMTLYYKLNANAFTSQEMEHVFLGPEFNNEEILNLIESTSFVYSDFQDKSEELFITVAEILAEGKVIGWFQGRMEFGPRSLGNRSILADPRIPTMRDRINSMVKKREGFRPFAPAILEEKMKEHFMLNTPSPFMLYTCDVISPISLPAITHVDNSARIQTVNSKTNYRFARLLEKFEAITECPILLNTSFNVKDEPIVCTPEDAIRCFVETEIDILVLGDFLIKRVENLDEIERIRKHQMESKSSFVDIDTYTFI